MKSMNSKTKRWLLIGCLTIVCVVLIAAISSRFNIEPVKDDGIAPSDAIASEVTPVPDTATNKETTEKKDQIVVKPVVSAPSPSTVPIKPTQNPNETVQSNAPEAVKPTPPPKPTPQGDTTNPTKPPEYKPEDTTKNKPAEPKAGEKNDKGEVWFPGFGWVKDEGGGTVVNEVGSDGDINKQVGSMNSSD